MARVSDRARFCHHCGAGLTPELVAGDNTEFACPACGPVFSLLSRRLAEEQVTVLECEACTGMWLGDEALRQLADRTHRQSAPTVAPTRHADPSSAEQATVEDGPLYRPCPICHSLMNRRHYGRSSGVVVDRCKAHGVWFDTDELSRILRWINAGGLRRSNPTEAIAGGPTVGKRPAAKVHEPMIGLPEEEEGFGMPLLQAVLAIYEWLNRGPYGR